MSQLIEELKKRFGTANVREVNFHDENQPGLSAYPFLLITIQARSAVQVLMTGGLSGYRMPVMEKFAGKEYNELYFCLPSYWDIEERDNPNMNWVFGALFRLQKHVIEKQSWFGNGHTIPFSNPLGPISENMRQMYFFFTEPVFLKEQLQPLPCDGKTVHFLGVVPIFEDEFDYKIGKGTYRFQKKMAQHNVTELLDDFRASVLKSKWRFFGKKA